MPNADIATLNGAIERLGKRWDDLKTLAGETKSLDRKLEIFDDMELINVRITRLEVVRNHMEAAIILVDPPSDKDRQQTTDALATLSRQIAKDMRWTATKALIKHVLKAAHTIHQNINGRQQKLNA